MTTTIRVPCPRCRGEGKLDVGSMGHTFIPCTKCHGTKTVEVELSPADAAIMELGKAVLAHHLLPYPVAREKGETFTDACRRYDAVEKRKADAFTRAAALSGAEKGESE